MSRARLPLIVAPLGKTPLGASTRFFGGAYVRR